MPLARVGQKLVYFAHVPKCAGTAIERYIIKRFGPMGLQDTLFWKIPAKDRWSSTSPQHMPETTRQKYVPDTFIDASFAVVRHPAIRLRSVFLFQREIEHHIDKTADFSTWLDTISKKLDDTPNIYDGHLRSMTDIVPDKAVWFKLENGLDPVVSWLDDIADSDDGPRKIKAFNELSARMAPEKGPVPQLDLTETDLNRIADLYSADYTRFNYDVSPEITKATQQ